MNRIVILLSLTFLLCVSPLKAQLRLPALLSSNMVLQQEQEISMWGWAAPNQNITIAVGWLDQPFSVTSNSEGRWAVKVKTPKADFVPYEIEVKTPKESIILKNVVLGEVWLCSGQSNMEMPLKGYLGQPVYGGNLAISQSFSNNVRLFKVSRNTSLKTIEMLSGSTGWSTASPTSVSAFSAVGYFFGLQLQQAIKVPIGLIQSSYGGTPIEAWMSEDAHKKAGILDVNDLKWNAAKHRTPMVLFNAMIYPLMPYTIRGAIWYQGESNSRKDSENYKKTLPAMVADWRKKFEVPNFPFYFVQIAPFKYKGDVNTANMRSVMMECSHIIPNTGMAVITDLGKENYIHPPYKKKVADRLFYLAMNKTYGYDAIDCEGPIYKGIKIEEGKAIISFQDSDEGIYLSNDADTEFEIAGKDKLFYKAKAKVSDDHKTLQVWSDQVPAPLAVRYAWGNYVKGTLFDGSMLPASSFKTNDW